MIRIRYVSIATFVAAVAASQLIALLFVLSGASTPVSAATRAETKCGSIYSAGSADAADRNADVRAACADGYQNGVGNGSVCSRYTTQSNGQALDRACRSGFDAYEADIDRCTDPSATPKKTLQECEQEMRSNASTPAPAGANANNPSSAVNLRLGPMPDNADVTALRHDASSEHTVCVIPGFFGNLVCGLTTFFAKIADASFGLLNVFLNVPPFSVLDSAGNQSATYVAWSLFRGIANVLFVIAFLMVAYAHLTGLGLNNYNIKRLLPRLIVASLLVNMSFYLCALLVDLSNILGATLKDTMVAAANQAINQGGELVNQANVQKTWEHAAGSTLLVSAGVAVAGGAALFGSFAILVPVLTSALVAIVTTVLVLMLRQVLVIVFIILSPLAFAAMILPNTSSYFDKWKSAFIPILLVFPAVSLLYGAGYIASISIQRTAAANGDTILLIMSMGVQLIPLALTPAVMKLGSSLIDRYGGITQTPGKALRKKADDYADRSNKRKDLKTLNYTASGAGKARLLKRARVGARKRGLARESKNQRIDENRSIAGDTHLREAIESDNPTFASRLGIGDKTQAEALQQSLAQSTDPAAMARARNHIVRAKVKAHAHAVEAKAIEEQSKDTSRNELLARAMNTDGTVTALAKEAAILQLSKAGDIGAILEMVKGSHAMDASQRQTLIKQMSAPGVASKAPFLANQQAQDNILQGRVSESTFGSMVVAPSLAADDYSADTYAESDQDAATEIAQVLGMAINGDEATIRSLGSTDAINIEMATQQEIEDELLKTGREKLREHEADAYTALTNSDTSTRVGQNLKDLRRIADKHISHEEAELEEWYRNRGDEP